jgi:hypothetical protein
MMGGVGLPPYWRKARYFLLVLAAGFLVFDAVRALRAVGLAAFGFVVFAKLASNSATRFAMISCSSRAFAAMALTTLNSSRGTKSISLSSRSKRCLIIVSISVRILANVPTAPLATRARSSKNLFSVCMTVFRLAYLIDIGEGVWRFNGRSRKPGDIRQKHIQECSAGIFFIAANEQDACSFGPLMALVKAYPI